MSRQPARCKGCKRTVVFFRSPFTSNVRTFDPTPVLPSHPLAGVKAFPVLGGTTAFKPGALAVHLMVQRQTSRPDAEDEVRDLPWHLIHECPTDSRSTT